MPLHSQPPSLKRNDWIVIPFGFSLLFCISYILTLAVIWPCFSNLGSISEHLKYAYKLAQLSLLPQYVDFLRSESLLSEFIRCLTITLLIALVVAGYLTKKFFYKKGGKTAEVHVSGPTLLREVSEIKRTAKTKLAHESTDIGIRLHPLVQISRLREKRNTGVFGTTGAGKTTYFKYSLAQIDDKKEHIFLFDEKKEYTEFLYDERAVLIAPWDSRSVRWDVAKDLDTESKIHNFAHMIIADKDKPFWHQSAVELFTGLVTSLKDKKGYWTWSDFVALTTLDEEELKALLAVYRPSLIRFIKEGNETSANVMMNLTSNIGWIEQLAKLEDPNSEAFSLTEYVSGNGSTAKVIVQSDNRYRSLAAPYFSALFSVFCTEFLSTGGINYKPTWLVLDEFGNLPKTEALNEWLSTSREYEARTIIGTQSVHQIYDIYGKDQTNSLLSMCGNLVCLAMSSTGEDANFFSKSLGEQVIERPSINSKNSESLVTWQKERKAAVEPNDLVNLPAPSKKGVSGFLYVNGYNTVFRLVWPYPKINKIAERTVSSSKVDQTKNDDRTPNRIKRRRESSC
ncbi:MULTISPECIES: type IV secretion system DNA-binding domain-containing protein [unclassified Pseudoalteromonas]|uniref:type IV secretion system DNA-binding domain-containing protein n=1 Tax=unclassified Pseudoalteromonas TaxID=194690 RepID=UPI000490C827|nr:MULTISPECIES: type IV secretion system DNA-binding domain-containing protein [unclassified Pseudoalteromonas]